MIEMVLHYAVVRRLAAGQPQRDRAETTWKGQHFEAQSAHGAAPKLARELIAVGCRVKAWRVVAADGRLLFSGSRLARLAAITCAETQTPRFAKYRPMPPQGPLAAAAGQDATRHGTDGARGRLNRAKSRKCPEEAAE